MQVVAVVEERSVRKFAKKKTTLAKKPTAGKILPTKPMDSLQQKSQITFH
jgi:hypothetical protein